MEGAFFGAPLYYVYIIDGEVLFVFMESWVTAVSLLGQVDATNLPSWVEWGILGLVLMAIVLTKQLVPGWIYAELKVENQALKEENKELVNKLLDLSETALPAIKESNTVLADAMKEIRGLRDARDRDMEEISRAWSSNPHPPRERGDLR